MKKSLMLAVAIVMSGFSLAWAGHFTDILPPAAASGCMPVSNGYDYNCTTDSSAPTPTMNGATITNTLTQSGGVVQLSTTTFTGGAVLMQRTVAQFQALTPSTTGALVLCTNCNIANTICISTGSTAAYQWILSTGTACK